MWAINRAATSSVLGSADLYSPHGLKKRPAYCLHPLNVWYIYIYSSCIKTTKGRRNKGGWGAGQKREKRRLQLLLIARVLSINSDLFHTRKAPETVFVPVARQLLDTVGEHTHREREAPKCTRAEQSQEPPRHFAGLHPSSSSLCPRANISIAFA